MNVEQHRNQDSMKVWLSMEEIELLIDNAKHTEQRIAMMLGAYCGLRSHEMLSVTPKDVRDTDMGTIVRVKHGKGDKYRETPCPENVYTTIKTVADVRSESDGYPLLSITTTRSLRKWTKQIAESCYEQTGDENWLHLSTHDLRRSWAGQLRRSDINPMIVLSWGGWNDLETFLNHYRGSDTPEEQRRERKKVDWL